MSTLRLLLVAISTGIFSAANYASDTLRIDRKVWQNVRSDRHFAGRVWENPALKIFMNQAPLSQILVEGFTHKETESVSLQQGDGEHGFAVKANSVLRFTPESEIRGTAEYVNKKRTSVLWNESSDYETIYPYVSADEQGGDLNSEAYRFSGEYTHEAKAYTWAARLAYRAVMEFRNVDPRPKNTVSDLWVTVAGSRKIAGNYRGAVSLHAGKYKQDNTLKFFNDLGGSTIYHLTGLGMHYVRFAGTNTGVLYDGASFGGSFEWLPEHQRGVSVSVGYRHFGCDKQMKDLGDITLCTLKENVFSGEAAYTNGQKGVKASVVAKKRSGTENLFGSPTGAIYPFLNSVRSYAHSRSEFKLAGMYGQTSPTLSWNLISEIALHITDENYLDGTRHIGAKQANFRFDWQTNKAFRHSSLTTVLSLGYRQSVSASRQMEEQKETDILKPLTDRKFQQLSSHCSTISGVARWDIPVSLITEGGVYIQANAEYAHYRSFATLWKAGLSLGLTF
ncbi:DUF6850 family outer membrane beta-barrel protein [Bacteroides pyogenes]|uniref:DUF6850 domain-containing protein n=2 Tax=Bacteroides pyogenes TaxID=310300 RepID=W4PH87_9BACE|nr:DUF6850 family outer membrane beta-barrel protein [Bacteroides pyogenes]GAE19186.1 hypothetical protein JCM6294_2207 [Bacteroides pyogenes DSM 20611 = JCM 6294]